MLEKERLCATVTGIPWAEFEEKMMAQEDGLSMFGNRILLANYFQSQIDVYAEMCIGRNYNVIFVLEKTFPYVMLLGIVANIAVA